MPLIKQYVNLPAVAGATDRGPTRSFVVRPNQVPNVAPGDRVDWWIEPNAGNVDLKYQSNALPAPPGTLGRTQLAHGARVGTTDATGHWFDNTITFTQVGGDRYVVKASRDGNRAQFVTADEFQTWRKLFYTVWHSNPESLARYNNICARWHTAYRNAFIELERKGVYPTPALVTDARVDYRTLGSATNDWPVMNGGPNSMMSLAPYGSPPAITLSDKPLHMALLLVPQGYFTSLERLTFAGSRAVVGSTPVYKKVFRDPLLAGRWLWNAQASWTGAGATDVTTYMSFTTGSPDNIRWNLTNLAGLTTFLALAPANNFRLDFTYIAKSGIGGYSLGNFSVVLCTGWAEDLTLQALTHEMGHGCGQVVQSELLYVPATGAATGTTEGNPNWYDETLGYGGVGPHCRLNAVLGTDVSTSSGQSFRWKGTPPKLCPMHYALDPNAEPAQFCPSCTPRLVRRDLRRPVGAAGTWNDFG